MAEAYLRAALEYADLGLRVLPVHHVHGGGCSCGDPDCSSAGKHPVFDAWTTDATTDPAQIRAWWREQPFNVGIATGGGRLVLDIDAAGEEWLREQNMPLTWCAGTGSGGYHYWFRLPDGLRLGNTAGRLAAGVDTRGDGGMVVVPPSVSSRGAYRWHVSPTEAGLEVAPEWLLSALQSERSVALLPERIPAGERNATLTSLAGSMRRRGASAEAILAALSVENERCQPPLERDELRTIAESVARYEAEEVLRVVINQPPPPGWLLPADDLLAMEINEPEPLVGGLGDGVLVARDDLAVWHGAPRTFKSMAALHTALCVATGNDVAGTFATRREPVIYVQEEGGAANWQRRLRWCLAGIGATADELRGWLWTSASARLRLDEQAWIDELHRAIEAHGARLLVVDPLAQVSGHDENDATETGRLVRVVREVQSRHNCSVILVAHDRKSGLQRRSADALRGSSALWAAAGTVSFIRYDEDAGEGAFVSAELKDSASVPRFGLRFGIDAEAGVIRVTYDGDATANRLEAAKLAIVAALRDAELPMTRSELQPVAGCSATYLRRALAELEDAKQIDSVGRRGQAVVYRVVPCTVQCTGVQAVQAH